MNGDKKVIEYLNDALRSELTAVSQYWLHYRMQEDWGLGHMAAKSREESIEEMNHADKIIARILFLGGHPNLQKAVTRTYKNLILCASARRRRKRWSATLLLSTAHVICIWRRVSIAKLWVTS